MHGWEVNMHGFSIPPYILYAAVVDLWMPGKDNDIIMFSEVFYQPLADKSGTSGKDDFLIFHKILIQNFQ
jgi:hypothetical protein